MTQTAIALVIVGVALIYAGRRLWRIVRGQASNDGGASCGCEQQPRVPRRP